MRYGSVCSGVEAATVAWHPLGWSPQWFSEIEKFPSAVLAHHYPTVPNRGDMITFKEWPDDPINLLVGGTPCQSFSVAGLRKGLDDPRGNLMLTYLAIAARYSPKWLVWENVPGVPSSNQGRDFGTFLGAMGELGYGFAYRVLDAQYFGVAQRRRRVFVVGYLGDWRRAAAVLFERESLSGHPAPSRKARKGSARGFECGPQGGGWADVAPTLDTRCKDSPIRNRLGAGVMTFDRQSSGEYGTSPLASTVSARDYKGVSDIVTHSLRGEGFDASEDGTGRGTPLVPVAYRIAGDGAAYEEGLIAAPLTTGTDKNAHAVAFDLRGREGGAMPKGPHDTANIRAASGGSSRSYVANPWAVRRLTPRECERLQGFPDDYTLIPYRGKDAADGPRYKAMGNSMAVPVMRWIGQRIDEVNKW
jgi:DNA (cytosine-5)-methyltransferase 1